MSKSVSRAKPVTYDPDPMDLQMRVLEAVGGEGLNSSDLANPQVVQLLIHNQRVSLTQLKVSQGEVNSLRIEIEQLKAEREKLRVELATIKSRENASWLEIPISILSGFAINMLTSNIKDSFGWFLLAISLLMLIYLRGIQLLKIIFERNVKE